MDPAAEAVSRSASEEGDAAMLARVEAKEARTLATEAVWPLGLPATSIAKPVRRDAKDAAKEAAAACGLALCGLAIVTTLSITALPFRDEPRPREEERSRHDTHTPPL